MPDGVTNLATYRTAESQFFIGFIVSGATVCIDVFVHCGTQDLSPNRQGIHVRMVVSLEHFQEDRRRRNARVLGIDLVKHLNGGFDNRVQRVTGHFGRLLLDWKQLSPATEHGILMERFKS